MKNKNKMYIGLLVSIFFISCGTQEEETISHEETSTTVVTEDISNDEDQVESSTKDVTAEEFKELIESGEGIILDVRTPGEFEGGFIEGAINIDFNSGNFEQEIEELDKTKPIYIYCQSGGRSSKAMKLMGEKGFTDLYNLLGGYGGWPYK